MTAPRDGGVRKVVFVTDVDLGGASGANVATRALLEALAGRSDAEVTLLAPETGGRASPRGATSPEVPDDLERWIRLPRRRSRSPSWQLWAAILTRRKCRSLLEEVEPDLVVVRLAPFFLLASRLFPSEGTDLVALVRGRPSMGEGGFWRTVLARITRGIGRSVLSRAERRLFAFREAAEAYGFAEGDRFSIVPNAADLDRVPLMSRRRARDTLRRRGGPGLEGPVVGFVGSLRARHRLEELLHASSDLYASGRRHELLIVGDGPETLRLRQLAGELSIESRVTFTGRVPHRDVGIYLCASDLVYSVVDSERPSNPIKAYEALAAGRPLVTSGTPELAFVEREGFGVLAPERESGGMADALRRGLDLEWDAGRAKAARRYIADHHTWNAVAETVLRGSA